MILKNLIYILQSENYDFKRFIAFAYTHVAWWHLENRQKIMWTFKAQLLWILTATFFWSITGLFFTIYNIHGLITIPFLIIILPILIGISLMCITPIDFLLKRRMIRTAEHIISTSKTRVIGIAGSYGKTSTKEILSTILSQKYEIIKTPENINTDIGIADFIIKNKKKFSPETIFVVEMGAYKKGEIEKICKMVRPTHSILTGINESHLERFGSIKNIIHAKFELPQNTTGLAMLNFDDTNIAQNHARFSIKNSIGLTKSHVQHIRIKEKFSGLEFKWLDILYTTDVLAEHNITLILLCIKIAQQLMLSPDQIFRGIEKLQPIEHRLQPIYNAHTDIMVIDDSYNGNVNGIKSGIEVLNRAAGRKVVLTPGLVELGFKSMDIHTDIADLYIKHADLVLLIKNKMTNHIITRFKKNKFVRYKIYETTEEAHDDLKNVLQRGDTIIFQNDLTDNYF